MCLSVCCASPRRSIRVLDLEGNDLGKDGATGLGAALRHNSTLTDLNIRWGRIGFSAAGAQALATALAVNTTLASLDMTKCELGFTGACTGACRLYTRRRAHPAPQALTVDVPPPPTIWAVPRAFALSRRPPAAGRPIVPHGSLRVRVN